MKDWSKRLFSTVLATTLLVSTVQPLFVLATEGDDTGLCEHHVTHENCGYVEAVAGADCTHEHDDSCYTVKCAHVHGDCGYMPAVEGVDCDHKHDNACGYTAPVAEVECTCQQEGHTTECAYAPAIPEGQCTHVHGECSYVEAKEEIPCGHDCAADEACNEKVLNCTHAHSESCGYVEAVEGKACEFVCETCAAEEAAAAAVAEVKTLIDALPELETVQEMALEEKRAAYAQTQAAYEAYNNLTEEQRGLLPNPEEVFKPLFDYFNTLIDADGEIGSGTPDGTPPVLKGVTLSRYTTTPNSTIEVTVDASDDVSGLDHARVNFHCEETGKDLDCYAYASYHNSETGQTEVYADGLLHGTLKIDQYVETGTFCIDSVSIWDIAENYINYNSYTANADHQLPEEVKEMRLQVVESNTPDGSPPVLHGITISSATVNAPGTIEITVAASDNVSGLNHARVNFHCEETGKDLDCYAYASYHNSETGQTEVYADGLLHGTLKIDQYVETGTFCIDSVSIWDIAENYINYNSYTSNVNYQLPTGIRALTLKIFNTTPDVTTSVAKPEFVETVENAANDAYIAADYSGNATLSEDVFDAIAGTDKTIDLISEGITWRFEGSDITNTTKPIDLSVQITKAEENTSVDGEAIQDKLNGTTGVVMKFAENGTLPGKATIQVKVDYAMREYLGSDKGLCVYYYNNKTGELEVVARNLTVINDTYVEFEITHCSYYVLTVAEDSVVTESGTCGLSSSWILEKGILTISGNGALMDMYHGSPWDAWKTQIKKVVIESGITSLGGGAAFANCKQLTEVIFSKSITAIEMSTFYGCTGLTSITIPEHITTIKSSAFSSCSNLKSIEFVGNAPNFESTSTGENNAFYGVTATAYYPADNETWTSEVMQNYGGDITWKPIGTAGTYGDTFQWSFDESNGTLTISGEGILYAGSSDAFPWEIYNDQIKKVVVENGVTILGEKMFITSQNLTHVTLPDTVTAISYDAFSNCTNLQQVNIPSSVESIHGSAFENCTNLTDVNIPDSVQVIKEEAFRNCSSLKEVTIPGSVTEISYATFADCSSLTEINISAGVTAICYDAFSNCTSLQQVHIPGSVESIYERAFENCTDLTELTIADGVKNIKEAAFRNCSSLTEVAIPDSVTEIAYATFANCSSLTEINIPSSVTAITYGAFDSCTGLQEVTISGTVTNISYEAFSNCTGLTTVKLSVDPAGITEGAFKNCDNLTTLVLSDNLKNMGTQALRTFPNVTTIRFTGNAPAFASDAFQGITATAYYPADKANWTSDILQNYGGNITWIAMNSGGSGSGNNPTLPPTSGGSSAVPPASGDDETDTGTVGGTVAPVVPTTPPTETPRDLIVIEKNDMSAAIQAAGNASHAEVEISAENKDGDMVSLPVESMKEIADADLSLSITTKEATISFDTKALDAITQQAYSKELYLKYQEIKEETLNNSQKKAIENQLSDNKGQKHVLTFTVELISDSKKIHDFRGGTATIKIPFKIPAGTKAEDFVVFYLNSNGEIERYETTYDGEYLIVRLNHFSEYAVVYDPDVEETVPVESTADVSEAEIQEADEAKAPPVAEEQPDAVNPFLFIAPAGVMLIALLIVVLIFLRRKKS